MKVIIKFPSGVKETFDSKDCVINVLIENDEKIIEKKYANEKLIRSYKNED